MSSFTHWLEKEVLDHFLGDDNDLYMGLSRTDGVRNITENGAAPGFAEWDSDPENPTEKIITIDGIDEPGQGLVKIEETWETESSEGLCDTYARVALDSSGGNWHDVAVVLGLNGDSELRLERDVEFPAAGAGEDWGTITHFFIADSITPGDGNILAYGSMPDSYQVVDGMIAKIWANTVVVRMTD